MKESGLNIPTVTKKDMVSFSGRREKWPDLKYVIDPIRQEEIFKEIEQKFFLQFTDAVVSYKACLRNLSPIDHNVIFFLKKTVGSPADDMMSARLGYNIIEIDEKTVTKEQRDKTTKFLADGVENKLIELFLKPERYLSRQESRIIGNFKNMETPEGNCYTVYGIRKLLELHFSTTKDDEKKDPKSIEYRELDIIPLPGLQQRTKRQPAVEKILA